MATAPRARGGGGGMCASTFGGADVAAGKEECLYSDDLAMTHAFVAEWGCDYDDDDEQELHGASTRFLSVAEPTESDAYIARLDHVQQHDTTQLSTDERVQRSPVDVCYHQEGVSDASPVKKAVKVHTRTRRAQEIRQLTAEREELETRLQMVREMVKAWPLRSMGLCDSSCDPYASTSPTTMVMTTTSRQQRWAEREREALLTSQAKNQRLRAELKAQKQAARSIYRLMLRRAAEMAALRKSLRLPSLSRTGSRETILDDRAVYARLLAGTRAMFAGIDRVATLLRSRIKLSEEGSFREWGVNERMLSVNGAAPSPKQQLQLVDCEELPFPRSQVHHAIRAFYKETEVRDFAKEHFTSIAGDEDTILMKLVFPYDTYDAGLVHVRMRQVVRSFNTPEYSGFVSLLEVNILTLDGQPSPMAPTIIEQKWTILPRTSKARDDNDASSLCEFETTQNQTFAIISHAAAPNHFQTPPQPPAQIEDGRVDDDAALPPDVEIWDMGYSSTNRRIQNYLLQKTELSQPQRADTAVEELNSGLY